MPEGKYNLALIHSFRSDFYFPTPIVTAGLDGYQGLNAKLLPAIRALREADPKGLERSNVRSLGGWHSQNNLHTLPQFREITEAIHGIGREISKRFGYSEKPRSVTCATASILNSSE